MGGNKYNYGSWIYEKTKNRINLCNKSENLFSTAPIIGPGKFKEFFSEKEWLTLKGNCINALKKNSSFDFIAHPEHSIIDSLRITGRGLENAKIIGSLIWNTQELEEANHGDWKDMMLSSCYDTIIRLNPKLEIEILKKGVLPLFTQELFTHRIRPELSQKIMRMINHTLYGSETDNCIKYQTAFINDTSTYELGITQYDCKDQHIIIAFQDITNIKKQREQKKEKDLLDIMKNFTAGLAHRFNNNLMGIQSTLDLWAKENQGEEQNHFLDRIYLFTRRSQNLVERLQGYSQKLDLEFHSINLKNCLIDIMTLISDSQKNHLNFVVETEDATIYGDADKIKSAIEDVIQNSMDSTSNGLIEISLSKHLLSRDMKDMIIEDYKPGMFLSIEIKDNGNGMSAKQIKRIFDPFYSTKKDFEGHGLGLASVFGTMAAHHGTISVKSSLGKGSCFTLYFPMVNPMGFMKKRINDDAEKRIPKLENPLRIMLVDDEVILLEVMNEIFVSEGYSVISFYDSNDSLDYYENHYKEIDLVILDMIMPNMDGSVLFSKMKGINPHVKAIMLSGFIHEKAYENLHNLGLLEILKKPIDRSKLMRIVKGHLPSREIGDFYTLKDINLAKSRLGNDDELFQRLLLRFQEHYAESRNQMSQLISNRQFKEAYPKAHQLKNQFNIIGFFLIAKKMAELEKMLFDDAPEEELITQLYHSMENELDKISDAVDSLMNKSDYKIPEKQTFNLKEKQVDRSIQWLEKGLKEQNLNSIKEAIQQLDSFNWPPHLRGKYNRLKRHCDGMQFTLAIKDIEQIRASRRNI